MKKPNWIRAFILGALAQMVVTSLIDAIARKVKR